MTIRDNTTQLVAHDARNDISMRPATMADLDAVVSLFNRCSIAMSGRPRFEASAVKVDWQTPGFNMDRSTRVVLTPENALVGYIEVRDLDPIPLTIWVWGRVHPDYEGLGIGTRLMNWAAKRAREAVARVPLGSKVSILSGTLDSHIPAKRLFKRCGMTAVRQYAEMRISLDQRFSKPIWPANIQLRTYADLPDLKKVHAAVSEAFRDHWGWTDQPAEAGLERWKHWIENSQDFDPRLWYLAMDGDEIAGVCLCQRNLPEDPLLGYVDELGVRRPWRRHGIALALLQHAFIEFQRRGMKRVELGVDTDSLTGANLLYERAGMHVQRRFDTFEKILRPGRELTNRSDAR